MNAVDLMRQAEAEGVAFRIVAPEGLKLIGRPDIVQRWLPTLKPHKPQILDALFMAERQRIIRSMIDWNERAALMTNAYTSPERAEAMAWRDLGLDEVFFGIRRLN